MEIGIIGLGDMGIGIANNIIKAGLTLKGFDLRSESNQNYSHRYFCLLLRQ